jgi:hypothetical protein
LSTGSFTVFMGGVTNLAVLSLTGCEL